ncbi:LCP family protein [Actinomadura sp. DC4]|uniref:LCP family protein n=1 Tax=Actinomadura sp. DC4 TaxID=3055069 RepID=UPI0025B0DA29|nr:LCP family protein [Actinomadura sp. DC4]MDN3352454.1 LCP family protein [Actinomadura sp. DC4]
MGQSATGAASVGDDDADAESGHRPEGSVWHALGLTAASVVVWGVAHLAAGRRLAGFLLMTLLAFLIGGAIIVVLDFREDLKQIAVERDWLAGITIGILVLALIWAAIVVRSYLVVRPHGLAGAPRVLAAGMVVVLVLGVCTPLAWAARDTYTLRDTIGTIFHSDNVAPPVVKNVDDPWKDKPRVNILLLGGDGAGDRVGVRTDSMTVASIDTKTGDTVLLSLPRNLQLFPVIPRLRSRWPNGFSGVSAGDEGLLNELFQDAENDKSLMPGYGKGRRGPQLVAEEISYLIGQPIDYYILVNLFGFADIIDAMGGVDVHIPADIPYGGPEDGSAPTGVLKAGNRHLGGKQALWFGRSRTSSSDFIRMGRQKCLMKDVAEQADPQRVLTKFQKLASAAKKTISTNIPAAMLPALVKLSGTMKQGAQVSSLMYVPPQFHVVRPDAEVMRKAAAKAIAASEASGATPSASPDASAAPDASGSPSVSGSATPSPDQPKSKAVSLATACG